MISVIIPTYNRSRCISRSIDSILNQTYQDFELIIVDDGSTDDTEELIKKYTDLRIHYKKINHSGAGAARNIGILLAKGDFIAFQDSDDIWKNNKLEKQIDCIEREKADIVFCAFTSNYEGTEKINRIPSLNDKTKKSGYISFYDLLPQNFCSMQTILFRKETFFEEKFNEDLPRLQDWELMLRMVKKYKVYFDNEVLVHQFIQEDSISSDPNALSNSLLKIIELLAETFKKKEEDDLKQKNKDHLILSEKYEKLQKDFSDLRTLCTNLIEENSNLLYLNNCLKSSDSWKITKPFRFLSDVARQLLKKNKWSNLFLEDLLYYKQNGVIYTLKNHRRNTLKPGYTVENTIITHEIENINSITKNNSEDSTIILEENLYQKDENFKVYSTDIKVIALYLPQYHTIKENDDWWGKGFTEWTNVKKAKPRFDGHYQPRIPDDYVGFYDLSNIQTIKKQILLAKKHGIYGFGFYYYWFSGKRLLEKPMEMFYENKDIEFPFMIIWANENWTRTWDGKENNILIAQEYKKDDAKNFIIDLKKYLFDKRYIKIDGKPVIGLYDPTKIPNVKKVINIWRKTARECGIGEILIWVCSTDSNAAIMGVEDYVDGEYEFPPRGKGYTNHYILPDKGTGFDYCNLIETIRKFDIHTRKIPVFRGSMTQWDNSARKKENYHCWINFSPERFYIWNRINIKFLRDNYEEKNRFLFINAWNEWGEGTYLEPDKKYGFSCINALSKAIFDIPYVEWSTNNNAIQYLGAGINSIHNDIWNNDIRNDCCIALHVHVFYPELINEIIELASHIPYKYDLYISTDTKEKEEIIREYLNNIDYKGNYIIHIYANKGRDVFPFIFELKNKIKKYKYVCHIHTKKSLHSTNGDIWREYLYKNLLGDKATIEEILYIFESNPQIGIIFPDNIDLIRGCVEWGSNKIIAENLLERMGLEYDLPDDNIIFPAGDMFWAKTDAIRQIFEMEYFDDDIPDENNQVDGTIMHAIERLWIYLCQINGYGYCKIRNLDDNRVLDILKP